MVAGPSGAGKGTLIRELLQRYPSVWLSVSSTTRNPRPGEKEGVHYNFLDEESFRDLAERGAFLEWAEVHGNLYGTPLEDVEKIISRGKDVFLEIDVKGARQVISRKPEAVTIFVVPPSERILEERLRGRGTEDEGELERRLQNALEESKEQEDYDYVVINDDLNRAVREFCAIYEKESFSAGSKDRENGR